MKTILFLFFIGIQTLAFGQNDSIQKSYAPIWSFQQKNATINGISVGLRSTPRKPKYSKTNGIKVEIFGLGWILLFASETPIASSDTIYNYRISQTPSERINGIAIAGTGSFCDCQVNGLTIGSLGHYNVKINGIGIALFVLTEQMNGIQIAAFNGVYYSKGIQIGMYFNINEHGRNLMIGSFNFSRDFKGLQLGVINKTEKLKGFQIGLWNVNNKRKFPLINWYFGI